MKNQQLQQKAMKISKAQVQQPKKAQQKKKGIFDLLKVIAIFGAIYIAYKIDNPFVWFGLIVVFAFVISGNKKDTNDFWENRLHYNLYYNPVYKEFDTNIYHDE